jgi:hypothetical protein
MLEREIGDVFGGQSTPTDDSIGPRLLLRHERRKNLVRPVEHYNRINLIAGGATRKLDLVDERFRERIGGVSESSDTAHKRKHVVEQFHAFALQLRSHNGQASEIPGRSREAWHNTRSDRIACLKNYGNLASCPLRRERTGREERAERDVSIPAAKRNL